MHDGDQRSGPHPRLERLRSRAAAARAAPRDWPLRTKLVVALLVPGLLAVALGALRVADQAARARELDRVTRFVSVHEGVAALTEQVQAERLRATLHVAGGRRGGVEDLGAAARGVDAERQRVAAAVESLHPDDAALVEADVAARQALDLLPAHRALATGSDAPASAVVARYSVSVDRLVELGGRVLRGVNPTEVSGLAAALAELGAARSEASAQQARLAAAGPGRALPPAEATELQNAEARLATALRDFRNALDPGRRDRYARLVAGATNTERAQLVRAVLAPGGAPQQAAAALPVYQAFLAELDGAEAGVRDELAAASADRRRAASVAAWLNALLLALVLLAGAVVVLLIVRQVIGSLRTLRESALDIASTTLPRTVARMRQGAVPEPEVAPVPIATREDVGQVARAFDAVHSQAVRLAAEQAVLQANVNAMYVNLSRRSQTLVERQLRLIEALEREEQDPDQLDSLFQLDHLATRMRRNCENLLVLAGAESSGSVAGVGVRDVVQAAVSETDQYQRIDVRALPDVAFVGRVSKDLWHLLAELLDNATNFSPPDTPVAVSGAPGAGGALILRIEDRGIGMPTDELAAVNHRLGRSEDATSETARRMGLFVVGQLARRHGIGVILQANAQRSGAGTHPQAGLTALVVVPAQLMHGGERPVAGGGARPVVPAPRADAPGPPAGGDGAPRERPPGPLRSGPAARRAAHAGRAVAPGAARSGPAG